MFPEYLRTDTLLHSPIAALLSPPKNQCQLLELVPGIVYANSPEALVKGISDPDVFAVAYRPFSLGLRIANQALHHYFRQRNGDDHIVAGDHNKQTRRNRVALRQEFPLSRGGIRDDSPYQATYSYLTEIGFAKKHPDFARWISNYTITIQSLLSNIAEECLPVRPQKSHYQINLGETVSRPHLHTDISAVTPFVGYGPKVLQDHITRQLQFRCREIDPEGWMQFSVQDDYLPQPSDVTNSPRHRTLFIKGIKNLTSANFEPSNRGGAHFSSPGRYRFVAVQSINIPVGVVFNSS